MESLEEFLRWWTTGRVGGAAGALGAAAAITAAVSGVRTLRRARDDSRERSRPMVAAELRLIPYVAGSLAFVVKNYGQSVARNVRVTFEPPIPDPDDPATSATPFLKRRYANPIPVMTPGMELDNTYMIREQPGGPNVEPTPEQVVVHISYHGPDGHRYDDEFPLDTEVLKARTHITSSASPDALAKEAVKALKNIHKALTQLQSDLRPHSE